MSYWACNVRHFTLLKPGTFMTALVTPSADSNPGSTATRWESQRTARFYEAHVHRNLFGEWELVSVWGAIGSPRGGHQCHPLRDAKAAAEMLAGVARRRGKRGYQRCGERLTTNFGSPVVPVPGGV
jgi:predicted DNA-binding WGR domain protein